MRMIANADRYCRFGLRHGHSFIRNPGQSQPLCSTPGQKMRNWDHEDGGSRGTCWKVGHLPSGGLVGVLRLEQKQHNLGTMRGRIRFLGWTWLGLACSWPALGRVGFGGFFGGVVGGVVGGVDGCRHELANQSRRSLHVPSASRLLRCCCISRQPADHGPDMLGNLEISWGSIDI
jgi:hypothetical protein